MVSPYAFLIMPAQGKRPSASTLRRRDRIAQILADNVEMPTPCSRCSEGGLKCVVEVATGYCAGCIRARSRCSLVLTKTERAEMRVDQSRIRLRLLEVEAEAARLRLELAQAEEKEKVRVRQEAESIRELEELEAAAGISASELSDLELPLVADSGWSQANFDDFLNSSLLAAFPLDLEAEGWLCGSPPLASEPPVSAGA